MRKSFIASFYDPVMRQKYILAYGDHATSIRAGKMSGAEWREDDAGDDRWWFFPGKKVTAFYVSSFDFSVRDLGKLLRLCLAGAADTLSDGGVEPSGDDEEFLAHYSDWIFLKVLDILSSKLGKHGLLCDPGPFSCGSTRFTVEMFGKGIFFVAEKTLDAAKAVIHDRLKANPPSADSCDGFFGVPTDGSRRTAIMFVHLSSHGTNHVLATLAHECIHAAVAIFRSSGVPVKFGSGSPLGKVAASIFETILTRMAKRAG
jgi:hypothetical protein